jgi:hypothetical protein
MQERLKDIYERITGVRPEPGTLMQPSIEVMMDAYEELERKVQHVTDVYKTYEPNENARYIFDLEQGIMDCWQMVDDVKVIDDYITDHPDFEGLPAEFSDKIGNLLLGLETLYQIKFQNTFDLFEEVCREYHRRGKCAAALANLEDQ